MLEGHTDDEVKGMQKISTWRCAAISAVQLSTNHLNLGNLSLLFSSGANITVLSVMGYYLGSNEKIEGEAGDKG
jgi:hypothetical protein